MYAGILRHPSLQTLTAYSDRLPSPEPASINYTAFPAAPQVGRIEYIGGTADLFAFTAVGAADDTTESKQALIARSVDAMIAAGTLPRSSSAAVVSFAKFDNHGYMHPRISADDLRAGLVQKLNALQGRRSTWYTGAAFSAQFTTVLWEYNKVLLPRLVEGL